MGLFSREPQDPLDLTYMGDVDAALHRRGHPWAFTLSLTTLLFFVVAYIWAANTKIDDVIRGQGKVIPASGVRDIQSDRGGTISEIRVQEGDEVKAGTVVVVISSVQEASALRDLQNKAKELELSLLRLDAEREGVLLKFSDADIAAYPMAVQSQLQIFESNRQKFEGEDNQLRSQIEQRRSEVTIAEQEKIKIENNLELLKEEEDKKAPLVRSGTVSRNDYDNLREQIIAMQGQLDGITLTIKVAEGKATAAEELLQTRIAERLEANATEHNKNRIELDTCKLNIATWTDQVSRAELHSPVDGTVKTIEMKPGSVARPAEVIMQIISSDDVLEIEAKFSPADRGFLYVSQSGMAKFTSYDFSIYGGLKATVIRISDDTILDKRGEPWYEVRLITKRKNIPYRGEKLPILSGMTVSIDILTDKRTVLDQILGPLFRAQQNAMTEH